MRRLWFFIREWYWFTILALVFLVAAFVSAVFAPWPLNLPLVIAFVGAANVLVRLDRRSE